MKPNPHFTSGYKEKEAFFLWTLDTYYGRKEAVWRRKLHNVGYYTRPKTQRKAKDQLA